MAYTDIDDPEAYFQVKIYTGTGSSQAQTFDGDTDMQPDMVWIKQRSGVEQHVIFDSVRGVQKYITPNTTAAEGDTATTLTAFGSDGFTEGGHGITGGSSSTYASWNWKEQAGVMDIVTYTGNGSNRTIAHNLGVKPAVMVHKGRSNTYNWGVYHHALSPSNERSLNFNTTGAVNVDDGGVYYNSTDPTSSVFSLGTNVGYNANNATYVAYLFAEKQGYSKFSSFVGNGNADGTFVYTGFKPAWVMWKRTDATNDWYIYDNKRNSFNTMGRRLEANQSDDEVNSGSAIVDFLSNGYKFRGTDSSWNVSGGNFIYMAFAEAPFVTSSGVPATAR
jgi:hypothetical protein